MVKIVKIKTELVTPMRTLFEVLKEILADTTIEFIRQPDEVEDDKKIDKKKKKKSDGESKATPFSGMRIMTVSPENTVLLCLKLHSQKFIEFVCKPKTCNIGVNLVALNKLLKSADKEDQLEMYIDNDDSQSLVLAVSNSEIQRNSEFKLKLMDIDPVLIKLPPVEPDVMITMDATEFHKLCKDMAQIGQFLEIKCTNSTLIFTCEGGNSSRETKYTANDNGVKIIFTNSNKNLIIQGVYELKHINLFAKCATLSSDVQLLMRVQKFPLCITYTVASLGELIACITPIEAQPKNTYEGTEELYNDNENDDEIEYKNEIGDD